jgi:multidrug efflux pump subunit AcrA (membrane-fusion protein)
LVSVILLVVIYWATITVVAYVTQPTLVMTTSPLVGGIAVHAVPAQRGDIAARVTYTGSVLPWQEVQVFPRVEGWLNEFTLYEGDTVEQGDVIARLDRAELGAMLDSRRAAATEMDQQKAVLLEKIDAVKAALSAAQASKAEAEANRAFWEREHERMQQLFREGAVAEFDLDNATRQHLAARAKVAEQEGRMKQQEANLAEMQARITQVESMRRKARAEVQRSRTVYGYTDVVAPISGRVAKRHVYAGVLVKPGMPIVHIQDLHQVRIQVRVAEQDMPAIKVGTPALVRFPSLPAPHHTFQTTVSTIFPQLDPATRTVTVEMVLDNPDHRIQTEMYTVVDLLLAHQAQALVIPRQAVVAVDGKPTVFTVDGSYATAHAVTLGIAAGEQVEVVAGLNEGELVIFKGNRALVDGQEVNLVGGF